MNTKTQHISTAPSIAKSSIESPISVWAGRTERIKEVVEVRYEILTSAHCHINQTTLTILTRSTMETPNIWASWVGGKSDWRQRLR